MHMCPYPVTVNVHVAKGKAKAKAAASQVQQDLKGAENDKADEDQDNLDSKEPIPADDALPVAINDDGEVDEGGEASAGNGEAAHEAKRLQQAEAWKEKDFGPLVVC